MEIKFNKQEAQTQQASLEEELELDEEYQFILNMHQTLSLVDPISCPSVAVIESWKQKYKNIYISTVVEPNKYFVWRAIRRGEYKKLEGEGAFEKQSTMHEVLVEQCLLYPTSTPTWRLTQPAGVVDTLGKQIAYHSGWISDQEAFAAIRVI